MGKRTLRVIALVMTVSLAAVVVPGVPSPTAAADGVCTPPPAGLIGWWPGDGNADDIAGNNDGTLVGGASFAPGKVGQAFSLDGSDDAVDLGSATLLENAAGLTLDAWVNPSLGYASDYRAIIYTSSNAGWALNTLSGTGTLRFLAGGHLVDYTTPLPANTWSHVAGTYDVATSTEWIYVNGVAVASRTIAAVLNDQGLSKSIGRYPGNNSQYFLGLIDEVEVFNRALTPGEIQAIYAAGTAGKCKPTTNAAPTPGSLCNLTAQFLASNAGRPADPRTDGLARSFCAKLEDRAGQARPTTRTLAVRAYVNQVRAQTGKALTAEQAAILLRLAAAL